MRWEGKGGENGRNEQFYGGLKGEGPENILKSDTHRECRRLHNEKLHSSYRSPNIVRMIKSL